MEYHTSDDRLSALPLGILHDILSRVPIREAIRTSLLSRQWRYTWTTLPHLVFKCGRKGVPCNALPDELKKGCGKSENYLITNVLLRHDGRIQRFKMSYPFYFRIDFLEAWILFLSRNDIRELILKVDWVRCCGVNVLKSSIYTCAKLTKLVLKNFIMDPPPSTFKGFLFLKSITFVGVQLSPHGVETLVGSCPILESLIIRYCSCSEVRIRSPNLKNLELIDVFTKLCLYAPLLVNLNVELMVNQFTPGNQSSLCNFTNFFGGFPNLLELNGCGYFMRYLSIGIESCHPALLLHHLNVIDLEEVDFSDAKEVAAVAHLIICAPNLRKVDIAAKPGYEVGASDVSSRDCFGCAPDFRLEKLKDVGLWYVCNYPSGVQLVKFLLETSPVLETMNLLFKESDRFDEVSAELLRFRRASPNAEITVRDF